MVQSLRIYAELSILKQRIISVVSGRTVHPGTRSFQQNHPQTPDQGRFDLHCGLLAFAGYDGIHEHCYVSQFLWQDALPDTNQKASKSDKGDLIAVFHSVFHTNATDP